MRRAIGFELCVESIESARIGEAGGADRVELCDQLAIGGVTSGPKEIAEAVRTLKIPVHVLIRPRGGDFVYSDAEFGQMRAETLATKAAGAAGVATGVLLPDGRVDIARTRELVQLASPMKITFHRAFDELVDMEEGLEDVIRTGADCLLTSGGKANVMEGAQQIAALQRQANGRLTIMPGGGLTLANMVEVARATGVSYLHGSLLRKSGPQQSTLPGDQSQTAKSMGTVVLEDVQQAVRLLRQ